MSDEKSKSKKVRFRSFDTESDTSTSRDHPVTSKSDDSLTVVHVLQQELARTAKERLALQKALLDSEKEKKDITDELTEVKLSTLSASAAEMKTRKLQNDYAVLMDKVAKLETEKQELSTASQYFVGVADKERKKREEAEHREREARRSSDSSQAETVALQQLLSTLKHRVGDNKEPVPATITAQPQPSTHPPELQPATLSSSVDKKKHKDSGNRQHKKAERDSNSNSSTKHNRSKQGSSSSTSTSSSRSNASKKSGASGSVTTTTTKISLATTAVESRSSASDSSRKTKEENPATNESPMPAVSDSPPPSPPPLHSSPTHPPPPPPPSSPPQKQGKTTTGVASEDVNSTKADDESITSKGSKRDKLSSTKTSVEKEEGDKAASDSSTSKSRSRSGTETDTALDDHNHPLTTGDGERGNGEDATAGAKARDEAGAVGEGGGGGGGTKKRRKTVGGKKGRPLFNPKNKEKKVYSFEDAEAVQQHLIEARDDTTDNSDDPLARETGEGSSSKTSAKPNIPAAPDMSNVVGQLDLLHAGLVTRLALAGGGLVGSYNTVLSINEDGGTPTFHPHRHLSPQHVNTPQSRHSQPQPPPQHLFQLNSTEKTLSNVNKIVDELSGTPKSKHTTPRSPLLDPHTTATHLHLPTATTTISTPNAEIVYENHMHDAHKDVNNGNISHVPFTPNTLQSIPPSDNTLPHHKPAHQPPPVSQATRPQQEEQSPIKAYRSRSPNLDGIMPTHLVDLQRGDKLAQTEIRTIIQELDLPHYNAWPQHEYAQLQPLIDFLKIEPANNPDSTADLLSNIVGNFRHTRDRYSALHDETDKLAEVFLDGWSSDIPGESPSARSQTASPYPVPSVGSVSVRSELVPNDIIDMLMDATKGTRSASGSTTPSKSFGSASVSNSARGFATHPSPVTFVGTPPHSSTPRSMSTTT